MYYRNGEFKLALPRYYKEKLYDKGTIKRANDKIQKKTNISEIRELMKDPLYYRKRWFNTKATINNYVKRTKKNKVL